MAYLAVYNLVAMYYIECIAFIGKNTGVKPLILTHEDGQDGREGFLMIHLK